MITREELKEHWNEIRGRIKDRWKELTDDDLRQAEGSTEQLIGVIQRVTGEGMEQVSSFLDTLAFTGGAQAGNVTHQVAEAAQHYAQAATRLVEEGCQNASQPLRDEVHQMRPVDDFCKYFQQYARERPDVVALWCFGIGFVVGWKLKPW